MIPIRLTDRSGNPTGDVRHVTERAAAGLLSRGRAVLADVDPPVPGESPVRELLAAVRDGTLDAADVLAAEQARDEPRATIFDRLGDSP